MPHTGNYLYIMIALGFTNDEREVGFLQDEQIKVEHVSFHKEKLETPIIAFSFS